MTTRRTQAEWIRSFAAQGMTREEIMGLLGCSRFKLNNALNRPFANDELPLEPAPELEANRCAKCGSYPYEQEPSRVGNGRHCGTCGAHYRYWADRRSVVATRRPYERKPSPSERLADMREWSNQKRRAKEDAKAYWRYHLDGHGLLPVCIDDVILEPPKPTPPPKAKTLKPAEKSLRELFEEHGPRVTKELRAKELQEAADAFLRLHDKRIVANPPPEPEQSVKTSGSFGGKSWRKDLGDRTDWLGELRAQADAGDENAQWRCWNLFDAPDEDEDEESEADFLGQCR